MPSRLHLTGEGVIEVDGVAVAQLLPAGRRLSMTDRIRDLFDDLDDAAEETEALEAPNLTHVCCAPNGGGRSTGGVSRERTWAMLKISSNSSA